MIFPGHPSGPKRVTVEYLIFNTLKLFWLILGQRKLAFLSFYEKEKEFSCHFGHNIISNGLNQAIRNNIGQKDN